MTMTELTELYTPTAKRSGARARARKLNSNRTLPQYQITDRYWKVVRHLPKRYKIPSSLVKIGIITDDIYNRRAKTNVDTSIESINKTPEAQLTPKVLSEFRRFMVELLDDDLKQSEKYSIGQIIDVSDLNIYPLNAGGFGHGSSTNYRGIQVEMPHEKFLTEDEYTSETYSQSGETSRRVDDERDSGSGESVLDDVDPERPH